MPRLGPLCAPMSYTRWGRILHSALAARRGPGAEELNFSRLLQQQRRQRQQQQQQQHNYVVSIAPHRQFSRFLATGTEPIQSDLRRRRQLPSSPVPSKEELPAILTAAGMVKLCGRPENLGSPLVGLDVAPSNFGVAVTDETRTFAIPLTRVQRRGSSKKLDPSVVLGKLQQIVEESAACGLVVGWPLSKSGRAEGQCLMVLQFLRQLHLKAKIEIPVTLRDERLTSVEARSMLKEEGLGRKIAAREDETAATIILQDFLDSAEAERGGLSTLPTGPSCGR